MTVVLESPDELAQETKARSDMSSTDGKPYSSLHALIIGINRYRSRHIGRLNGAVRDADAIRDYLVNELHVSGDQIFSLRDSEATRSAILDALRDLCNSKTLRKGDPVLLYFAGHGLYHRRLSYIIPHDFTIITRGNRKPIEPIPAYLIGKHLYEMSCSKGNNITVILDCCHSGFGTFQTQYGRDDGLSPTVAELYESHVLLAACDAGEKAIEDRSVVNGAASGSDRGHFTSALLETLYKVGPKVTYRDLIFGLPTKNGVPPTGAAATQRWRVPRPGCMGQNIDRLLFSTHIPESARDVYPVKMQDARAIVAAGEIHGVSIGTAFRVFLSREISAEDQHCAAIMRATQVEAFQSTLELVSDSPSTGTPSSFFYYAQKTSWSTAVSVTARGRTGVREKESRQGPTGLKRKGRRKDLLIFYYHHHSLVLPSSPRSLVS
ncbi:hypothetical protein PENSPDRAFT_682770 [Peniophora sp. CONT]|nr:hypothetical protein PENSPDRAFT_682770 [Peniophora sp. CONT]